LVWCYFFSEFAAVLIDVLQIVSQIARLSKDNYEAIASGLPDSYLFNALPPLLRHPDAMVLNTLMHHHARCVHILFHVHLTLDWFTWFFAIPGSCQDCQSDWQSIAPLCILLPTFHSVRFSISQLFHSIFKHD
jgi:hypothetical protein